MLKHMLLEKCVVSIHMRTVEKPVAVYNVFPKTSINVVGVVIFLVLDVVLVRRYVFDLASSLSLGLYSSQIVIVLYFTFKKGSLKSA